MKHSLTLWLLLSLTPLSFAAKNDYTSSNNCQVCKELDQILAKFNNETNERKRIQLLPIVSAKIRSIQLKGKSNEAQRREIYFAINAAREVMGSDFESDTFLQLIDLRAQSKTNFDYVFHRFPEAQQKDFLERMKSYKEDGIRPKADLPQVQAIDPES